MKTSPVVSEKNTKKEILDAYQELVNKLHTQPHDPQLTTSIKSQTQAVKNSLSDQVAELSKELTDRISDLVSQFDKASQILSDLHTQRQSFLKTFEQEKSELDKQRQREAEEYEYDFNKRKIRLEAELSDKRNQVDADIAQRKAVLKQSEDELKMLRDQVATFEKRLADEIKKTEVSVTKELKLEFDHKTELAEQKAKAEADLLKQQVSSLQQQVTSQDGEIKQLQGLLKEATVQVSKIAERAVTRTPEPVVTKEVS